MSTDNRSPLRSTVAFLVGSAEITAICGLVYLAVTIEVLLPVVLAALLAILAYVFGAMTLDAWDAKKSRKGTVTFPEVVLPEGYEPPSAALGQQETR